MAFRSLHTAGFIDGHDDRIDATYSVNTVFVIFIIIGLKIKKTIFLTPYETLSCLTSPGTRRLRLPTSERRRPHFKQNEVDLLKLLPDASYNLVQTREVNTILTTTVMVDIQLMAEQLSNQTGSDVRLNKRQIAKFG